MGVGRQVRDGQAELSEARYRTEADEDESTDAGGEQPGSEYQRGRRPAEPDGLHHQERSEQRGSQQGRNGGEAARAAHHRQGLRGGVVLDEPHDERGDPAAQGDEGRLRADDGPQAERRQGGDEDAPQLDGCGRPSGLEPVGGRVTARARQVANGRPDEKAGHHQRQNRPPGRRAVETQPVGQVAEHPFLEVVDEPEEVMRRRRDRHPENRGEHEQNDVAASSQHGEGIGWHRLGSTSWSCCRTSKRASDRFNWPVVLATPRSSGRPSVTEPVGSILRWNGSPSIVRCGRSHVGLPPLRSFRILKPGGHATLELESVHRLMRAVAPTPRSAGTYVNGVDVHGHHYYSYDEIFVLFSETLGVTDLDITLHQAHFWVHFSKDTERRFHNDDIEPAYFMNRQVPETIRFRGKDTVRISEPS